jgi:hypothetical protein
MIYCKECIQINPLPKCLEPGDTLNLTGITFPDNVSSDLYAILYNISSLNTIMWTIGTDANGEIISTNGVASNGLDVTEAYDLMNHSYEIEFTNTELEPVTAVVQDKEGCCIKFGVLKPLKAAGDFPVTTGTCNA